MVFDLNLEVQFLLKQGQVEVDMGRFIPDFSDSVLVHRSWIEELNSQIKVCFKLNWIYGTQPHHECRHLERENYILWLIVKTLKEEFGC